MQFLSDYGSRFRYFRAQGEDRREAIFSGFQNCEYTIGFVFYM